MDQFDPVTKPESSINSSEAPRVAPKPVSWSSGLYADLAEFALGCFCAPCLGADRMEHLGYNYWTTFWFGTTWSTRERIAGKLTVSEDAKGFFHTNLGAIFLNLMIAVSHYTLPLYWCVSSAHLAQATRTAIDAAVIGAVPASRRLDFNFPTQYCDVCADGKWSCLAAFFMPHAYVAYKKSKWDGSGCCFNLLRVSSVTVREDVRRTLGIRPGPICDTSPCCADMLPMLCFCGAIQLGVAMQRSGYLLSQQH